MFIYSSVHVSSYLTQCFLFGPGTRLKLSQGQPAARLLVQLAVHWLPWQHCQVQEPPVDQRRVPDRGEKEGGAEARHLSDLFHS